MTVSTWRRAALAVLVCVAPMGAAESARGSESAFSVVSVLHDPQALARPHDVEVDRGRMFVPGKGGSIAVVDVHEPARPQVVWWIRNPEDDAQTVLCHGRHLLVGSRDFFSIEISEAGRGRVCKRLRERPEIDRINGMILWGDHVVYANKTGWIGAVDVRRPGDPVLAGALNTREHGRVLSPHDVARSNDCAIVVDQRDGSPWKVRAYRVADPASGDLAPVERWRAEGAVAGERLNGANRVVVRGDCALVACNKADALAVVDFSDPAEPAVVGVHPLPGSPCGLELAGNALFAGSGQSIHAFDVTDPRRPVALAAVECLEVFPTRFAKDGRGRTKYTTRNGVRQPAFGNAHDLVYEHGYLYVTAQSDDQVAILRVEDPRIRRLAESPKREAKPVPAKPSIEGTSSAASAARRASRASSPPAEFGGSCVPVAVDRAVTMTADRRVRPQALVFDEAGRVAQLLYTTDGSDGVSIATALAETSDGGATWCDHPANPVLNRIESAWQGTRAFVTGLTRDDDHQRWVMATVGNDATASTPGIRATGLWFSDDLVRWTQHPGNPIITVNTDGAAGNDDLLPGPADLPVGMYLRHFHKIDGVWYALVQWRGAGTWSRMTVMESGGDITGPWKLRNLCLDPEDATDWLKRNRNLNWCQPVRMKGRWYAACQNGVARGDRDNDRVGIVYSDDYFHWHEFDNPVTPPLRRPDGTAVVPSQQFLLPPEAGKPWRILLGARGVYGDKFMYLVYPEGWAPAAQ